VKQFKTLVALVLAVMMVLSVASVAFADDPAPAVDTTPYQHPISVSGLAAGETATFYKMVAWVGEDADAVAGWKAVSPYNGSGLLDKAGLTAVLLGTAVANSNPVKYENPTGITPVLAGKLAKVATGGTEVTADNTGKATLSTNEAGIYMVLVTPGDANTLYNPIFVSADYRATTPNDQAASTYDDTATVKKSTVTLTKEAANANDYNGDNAKTTAIGDTVTFTVNTQIPGYGDVYTNPHFNVVDTLTDLTLNTDSVTVTAPAGLQKGTDYTVSADASGYTLSFSVTYLKTVKAPTPVTITYSAVVATEAPIQINEETNDVYIEYSHNPSAENDYDVKKDTTQHYTFTLDAAADGLGQLIKGKKTSELVKIGLDANGDPIIQTEESSEITTNEKWKGSLANAEFGLWKNAQCTGTAYKTQTTGTDGRMTFAGLDAGTYYLKEISAPDGYVTQSDIHTVVIAAETETITVTEWWNGSAWVSTKPSSGTAKEVTYQTEVLKSYTVTVDDTAAATYTFTNESTTNSNEIQWETVQAVEKPFKLENTKGVELPSTGGIGTTIFYVVGLVLVLGAAAIVIARRKAEQ